MFLDPGLGLGRPPAFDAGVVIDLGRLVLPSLAKVAVGLRASTELLEELFGVPGPAGGIRAILDLVDGLEPGGPRGRLRQQLEDVPSEETGDRSAGEKEDRGCDRALAFDERQIRDVGAGDPEDHDGSEQPEGELADAHVHAGGLLLDRGSPFRTIRDALKALGHLVVDVEGSLSERDVEPLKLQVDGGIPGEEEIVDEVEGSLEAVDPPHNPGQAHDRDESGTECGGRAQLPREHGPDLVVQEVQLEDRGNDRKRSDAPSRDPDGTGRVLDLIVALPVSACLASQAIPSARSRTPRFYISWG
jgi:hypothetical protein